MSVKYALWDASDLSEQHWRSFKTLWRNHSACLSGFMDPEFALLINEVRKDVSVLIATENDEFTAFWPMHIGAGRWARGLGSPFSDRNGPVVTDGFEFDIGAALRAVSISGYSTQGLVRDDRTGQLPIDQDVTYQTDLSGGYPSYFEAQSKSHKSFYKSLRRNGRKADTDFDSIEFVFDDQREDAFDALIALKRRQFETTRRHDVLGPEWVQNMLKVLRSGTMHDTRTVLSTLYYDGELAAAELNMSCGHILHGWLVAYDPKFSRYSPGSLIIQRILEAMPGHGFSLYDYGTGAGHYKEKYANKTQALGVGTIDGDKNVLNPVNLVGNGWAFLEKQSPEKVSVQLGKIRRRYDQIVSTETRFDRKALGMAKALRAFGNAN